MPALVVSSLVLRAHSVVRDGVDGWLPLLDAEVRDGTGPLVLGLAGAELEVPTQQVSGGAVTRELLPEGDVLTVAGELPFTLRMRGELLFEGRVVAEQSSDGWVLRPATMPPAFLTVEASADEDAPWLAGAVWLPEVVDESDLDLRLLHDGRPVAEVDVSSARRVGDSTRLAIATSAARAWLLAEYPEFEDDPVHELFESPGAYGLDLGEADSTAESPLRFDVDGGVVRTGGPAELDLRDDLVLFTSHDPVWGGTVAAPVDVRAWYERFIAFPESETDGAPEADGDPDAVDRDPAAADAIAAVETHRSTYLDDLVAGGGSLDHDQVDYALSDFLPLRERLASLLADSPDDVGLIDARARLDELIAAAERILRREDEEEDALLAPYRAVLSGDKLAICLDRPPHLYRYFTSGKREISAPDDLAAASTWYFEGGDTEGGLLLEVTSWSVLGYRFDTDHALVDSYEDSGLGRSAPTSAFP